HGAAHARRGADEHDRRAGQRRQPRPLGGDHGEEAQGGRVQHDEQRGEPRQAGGEEEGDGGGDRDRGQVGRGGHRHGRTGGAGGSARRPIMTPGTGGPRPTDRPSPAGRPGPARRWCVWCGRSATPGPPPTSRNCWPTPSPCTSTTGGAGGTAATRRPTTSRGR